MKKLFSRLLPAVLGMVVLSATTAFAQVNADAKAVYDDMEAKSMLMSDANMYLNLNMVMSDGAQTMDMNMAMNMLCKNMTQPDKIQYLSKNIMTVGGQQMNYVMWYNDGYSYMEAEGQKVKVKADVQDTMATALNFASTMGSSSELFSDLSMTTEGDTRILNYRFDDTKMNNLMTQMFNSMGLESLLSGSGIQMNIHDVKGSYILTPDNFYSSATISMNMDMTADGETLSVIVAGTISVLDQGKPVVIEFPDSTGFVEQPAELPAA